MISVHTNHRLAVGSQTWPCFESLKTCNHEKANALTADVLDFTKRISLLKTIAITGRCTHVLLSRFIASISLFIYIKKKTNCIVEKHQKHCCIDLHWRVSHFLSQRDSLLLLLFCVIKYAYFFIWREFEVPSKLLNHEKMICLFFPPE